ncbi:hypothetical protein HPB49_009489 [Dermacentor silvarum]|uniref:Uncharacterized protein n=1 Tax=Dermacentor silvarum TaxID=543639 RepID=A0ACB8CKF2_DERSI|nr:hypothetical protein HPB49_009489 [Dermacentor silvarum]
MADSAHPRWATAPTSVSGAPGEIRLVNAEPSRTTCNRALFAECAGAVFVLIIVVIVLISVYISVRQRRKKPPSDTEIHSFCCPDEVKEIARQLNTSVDPCDDFFAYVCSSSIELNSSKNTVLDFRLKSAIITGTMPNNVRTTNAARFLNSFYQTCVTVSHRESLATSLSSALLQEEGDLLNQVDSRMAMIFIMTASFRYSIRSVLTVEYQRTRRALLGIKAICDPDARSLDYLNATVDALKRTTNSTATTTGTAKLAATLCEQFKEGHGQNAIYYLSNGSTDFSREIWNIDDIKAGVNAQDFTLDVKFIKVQGVKEIHLLYGIFTNCTNGDTKAAYLLWHAVARGMEQISSKGAPFSPQVAESCAQNAFKLFELRQLLKAEILTTLDKDAAVRKIFALIKNSVHEQFKRIVTAAEDAEKRDQFFENVRLVTPMEESRASVPVPKATQNFAENFLKGRRFNHEVNIARRSKFSARTSPRKYRDFIFLEDRYILLSPVMYDFIRTGPNSLLPNMAILGHRLAESLWSMALLIVKWKSKTKNKIMYFIACFYAAYLDNAKITRKYHALCTSLGLSTVRSALNWTHWYPMQHAWSLWTLSHAQLFYMLNTYYRCPKENSPQMYAEINVPIMYVQDFAKAFSCSKNASLTKAWECLDLYQAHT